MGRTLLCCLIAALLPLTCFANATCPCSCRRPALPLPGGLPAAAGPDPGAAAAPGALLACMLSVLMGLTSWTAISCTLLVVACQALDRVMCRHAVRCAAPVPAAPRRGHHAAGGCAEAGGGDGRMRPGGEALLLMPDRTVQHVVGACSRSATQLDATRSATESATLVQPRHRHYTAQPHHHPAPSPTSSVSLRSRQKRCRRCAL